MKRFIRNLLSVIYIVSIALMVCMPTVLKTTESGFIFWPLAIILIALAPQIIDKLYE